MASKASKPMKTVLITGCSAGGSGSALAKSFHQHGLHVFATARSLSKMSHLQDLPNITFLELDVVSSNSISAALKTVQAETGGKLDYLVNNSGQSLVMPCLDVDIEEGKKMFDVNFWGVLAVTQAFAPLVVAAKGCVVNICSINGHINVPWQGIYGASKTALELHSETLRVELAPFGVRVVAVVMGAVDTNIMNHVPEDFQLPPASIYQKVFERIKSHAKGETSVKRMDAAKFADKVVGDVLGGANGLIWRGAIASVIWIVTSIMPAFVVDRLLIGVTGVDELT